MKHSRLALVTGLVGVLTLACSATSEQETIASPKTALIAQQHEQPKITSRQLLDQYKREQKDILYTALSQEKNVAALFAGLPETIRYHDKRTWDVRSVGPLTYFFDLRSINLPENTKSSLMAYLRAWGNLSYNPTPNALPTYNKNVTTKAKELGLEQEYDIVLLEKRPLLPFYEAIQNPTARDLGCFYDALAYVPPFVAKPFLSQSLADHFEQTNALFVEEPALYQAKLKRIKCCDINVARPKNSTEPITTGRYPSGEIRIPERAYGNVVEQDDMVFPPQIEDSTSPFAKFLYRRGPAFTGNLEVIMGAYYTSFDKQDFLQKAQAGLVVARQVQE